MKNVKKIEEKKADQKKIDKAIINKMITDKNNLFVKNQNVLK